MNDIESLLEEAASKYSIDPALLKAVAMAESGMNHYDEITGGVLRSNAGALGIMQLMPETAYGLGVDPYDLRQNIEGGAKYLRKLLDTFGSDMVKAVAAYNAGPGAVQQYGGVPPFPETVRYVNKVLNYMGSSYDGSTGTRLGQSNKEPGLFSNVDPGKCYFKKPLQMDRRDDLHSEIDPTQFAPEDIANLMHYNNIMYNRRGRLVQAFPTFLMMFVDEGEWVGGRKLWDNFYFYHSMVSLDIVKERGNPADLAYMELTNVYGALNHYTIPPNLAQLSAIQRLFPAITEQTLEMRRRLFKDLMIRPGARVHIRMGYGSQASGLPVVFNGTIVEVDAEEMATFVAQGDGHELLNEMLQFGPDAKNSFFNLGSEPTSVIALILAKRGLGFHLESNMFKNLMGKMLGDIPSEYGKGYSFGASNPYGIEHFGVVKKPEGSLMWPFVWGKRVATFDVMMNVYSTVINMGEINKIWRDKAAGITQEDKDKAKGLFEEALTGLNRLLEGFGNAWKEFKEEYFNENNIGVWLGKKTPWDVFRVLAKCTTGYIVSVVPFQFRSTFFFGLPWWPMCIKYTRKKGGLADIEPHVRRPEKIDREALADLYESITGMPVESAGIDLGKE